MGWLYFLIGAALGIVLLSRVAIWALRAWKLQSIPRLTVAHLLTYLAAAVGSAYGFADDGPVQWALGFTSYALPCLLVAAIDTVALLRAKRQAQAFGVKSKGGSDEPAWFIHVNGEERGPLGTAAVKDALAAGTMQYGDWIWRPGMQDWAQILSVDQFAAREPEKAPDLSERRRLSSSYFLRHWRGQLSLAKSYWLSGIAVACIVAVPLAAVRLIGFSDFPRLISAIMIFIWPMSVIAQLWLSIGIWRSADRYTNQNPKKYWGSIAKLSTTLAAISAATVFVTEGLPQMGGFAEIFADANQKRYAIRLLRENTELEIAGPLDFGLAQEVEDSLALHPTITVIHLRSQGGRLGEAEKLASHILQRRLNTYVKVSCASACVNVFAAGKERWLSREAVLGLHKPYFPGLAPADLEAMTVETRAFLISRGVSTEFVDRGLAVPHESVWNPTHRELFESGLATAYATDSNVAMSGLSNRKEDIDEGLQRIEPYKTLRDRHPEEYAAIIDTFQRGAKEGRTISDLRGPTWVIILALVKKSLPSASDEALVKFYQTTADEVAALSKMSAEACDSFLRGDPAGYDMSAFPDDLRTREADAIADLIRSKGAYTGAKITDQQVEQMFTMLSAAAVAAGLTEDEFYRGAELQLSAAQNCKATLILWETVMALNPTDRMLALRFMAQQPQ